MGGHGHALEALWLILEEQKFNIQNCRLDTLMNHLYGKLTEKYPAWVDKSSLVPLVPPLKAVLARKTFNDLSTMLPGCNGTIDDYVKLGLFRWNMHKKQLNVLTSFYGY